MVSFTICKLKMCYTVHICYISYSKGQIMNMSTLVLVLILATTIMCASAQQHCGNLQYLNTTTDECTNINTGKLCENYYLLCIKSFLPLTASDFGLVFNQTSYAVVTNLTLALIGAPLVKFTVYFSDSVTSSAATSSWTVSLLSIS